jgi:hypothetical protein
MSGRALRLGAGHRPARGGGEILRFPIALDVTPGQFSLRGGIAAAGHAFDFVAIQAAPEVFGGSEQLPRARRAANDQRAFKRTTKKRQQGIRCQRHQGLFHAFRSISPAATMRSKQTRFADTSAP